MSKDGLLDAGHEGENISAGSVPAVDDEIAVFG